MGIIRRCRKACYPECSALEAAKWLESAGAPICPAKDHGQMSQEPLGAEGEGADAAEAESLLAA